MTPRRRRDATRVQRGRGGFTLVELMIAVAVFTIGVTGIIALQQVTVVANKHSKNLALASHIAAAWIDQLTADASLWDRSGLGNTTWLRTGAALSPAGTWFRPAWDAGRQFGPAFDALGDPIDPDSGVSPAFCTEIAVTRLYQSPSPNALMRVEVRVYWLRESMNPATTRPAFCGGASDTPASDVSATAASDPTAYHFVHTASAVRQMQ